MGLKVKNGVVGIPACDMNDGVLYVIVAWTHSNYLGAVVQRFGDNIQQIGKSTDSRWSAAALSTSHYPKDCRVAEIRSGAEFVLTDD